MISFSSIVALSFPNGSFLIGQKDQDIYSNFDQWIFFEKDILKEQTNSNTKFMPKRRKKITQKKDQPNKKKQ
jgi:hypothetical protein